MADAELKVRIEAEMAGLAKGLNASVKLVDNAGSQISKSVQGLSTSFKTLNNTKFTFGQNYISASKSLATEAQKTGAALGGSMTVGSNRAAFALTNLGRVAQDAPFGFMGIQNNLNPLLESFQMLRKETGSNVSAFKALAGGLVGPAGLGLALSLVSSAFLLYQEYTRKASKETKELDSAISDLSSSVSKDIAKVTLLYDASQNLNIPLKERKKIVDELQKQYPTTFGNLTDEAILAGKAKTAYDGLTQSLINAAVVRGGEDLIAAKIKPLAENLLAFQEQQRKFSEATKGKGFLAKNTAFNVDENGDLQTLQNYEANVKTEIANIRKSIQGVIGQFSAEEIIGGFDKEIIKSKDVKTQSDVLKQLAIDLAKVENSVDITFGEGNKQKVTAFAKAIDSLTEIGGDKTVINKLQNDLLNINPAEITAAGKMIGVTLSTGIASGFSAVGGVIAPQLNSSLGYINQQLIDFNSQASDIINGSIVNTFAGIGQAIGESISTGASLASTLGQVLLSSLGSVLGQLGQLAIATGVAILGIKLSLKSLNPVAAIAAGVALLALSGVVRGAANKIGGGVGGAGGSTSPQPAYSASSGTSSYSASSGGGGSGTVVFEISGTNLVGVLNRAGAKLQRFGP